MGVLWCGVWCVPCSSFPMTCHDAIIVVMCGLAVSFFLLHMLYIALVVCVLL